MKLENIRIGKRLAGGYIVLVLIIGLLCIISFQNMKGTDEKLNEIENITFRKATLVNTVIMNLQAINKETTRIVYTKDRSRMNIVGEKRKLYLQALEELEKLETSKEGQVIIERFKAAVAEARDSNVRLAELIEAGEFKEAGDIFNSTVDPALYKFTGIMDELWKYQEADIKKKHSEILAGNEKARLAVLIFGIVSFVFSIIISILITKSITVPIGHSMAAAKTLAEGDLSLDIPTDRKDEFGDEMKAVKLMVEKWKTLIVEVRLSATNVASASQQLSMNAEDLAKGGIKQVEKTIQVSTASEEMSQTSLDIAKNVSSISISATEMVGVAENGNDIVNRSVSEVAEIAKTVNKSSEFVKELGKQSERIGEIVDAINEIADQTNLLALNAAIEAARAGDAGRGFAVVADEVKKLAERTSRSTQEIGDMISSIKTGVENAVESMSEASNSVKAGVELSGQAGNALVEIVGSASNLQIMVQQIAAAIEEMNATTDEIARDIEHVAIVTKEASNSAEQVTNAALELSNLSTSLEMSVREFKV